MSRRSLTLSIAGLATLIAIAVAVLVPVPYVILGPGPTLNTLGSDSSGQPLITISGHPTYPTNGHLNMVTVSYQGGPGANLNIFQALRAWLNPSEAVVPESELFPPGQSAQQTQQQDTEQMASSQETATAAALTALHIPYQTQVQVTADGARISGEQGAQDGRHHPGGGRQAGDRAVRPQLADHRAPGGFDAAADGAARRQYGAA